MAVEEPATDNTATIIVVSPTAAAAEPVGMTSLHNWAAAVAGTEEATTKTAGMARLMPGMSDRKILGTVSATSLQHPQFRSQTTH